MSSLIHTMIMGTPSTRRLRATVSALYLLALSLGFAMSFSGQAAYQLSGLFLAGAASLLLWRRHRDLQNRLAQTGASADCWQALMAGSPDSVMLLVPRLNPRGVLLGWEIREANRRAHDLFAENDLSLLAQTLADVLPGGVHASVSACLEVAHGTKCPQTIEHAMHDLGDEVPEPKWLHHQVLPCALLNDQGLVLITRDTTAQHTATPSQTADALRLASRVIEATGDAVVVSDALDRIEMVNPAFLNMTGMSPSEVIGKSAELLGLPPLRDSHLPGVIDALTAAQRWSGESLQLCADGRTLDTWLSVSTLRNERLRVTQHVRVFSDISDLKARQRELVEQARHDSLTGLPNRRAFSERLNQAMARARRNPQTLAVLYVDLDGFKAVNDQLGHAAGDEVLTEVAKRLLDCVRLTDCVCRLAGDEFTVILEGAGHAGELRRICQRILDRLSLPHELGGAEMLVTPSIGAAVYEAGETHAQMCERADAAMYAAKRAGKARFVLSIPERSEGANALTTCPV